MSQKEGLRANSFQFTLEGEPFRILGGSIHYFRVPRAYWEDRLLKMRACGVNTLTTYVPWNLHEPERGVFNFQDQLDLNWLLRDKNMKLRTTYPGFTEAVNSFFDKLIPIIKPLQFEEGGPIIAVQVENEYGSYAKDEQYMPFIKEALLSRGTNELLLTSDNREGLKCGGVDGVLKTVNLQRLAYGTIQYLAYIQPQKPLLLMEYWSGWFDVWSESHHVFPAEDMLAVVSQILEPGVSINLYMFHGGTSFGFMNGAVANLGTYKPQVGSYDYDAPLSEAGDYTTKYQLLRNLFSQFHSEKLPEVPSLQARRVYEPVIIQQHLSLWESLQFTEPLKSEKPVNMENLPVNSNNGQSYGYTLYETTISSGGLLNSRNNVKDRALVFVDRHFVGVLDYKSVEFALPDGKGERTLSLLVENCGRVNYGKALDDQRKGLVGDIVLNHVPLKDFTIYCLDMKPNFLKRLSAASQWNSVPQKPSFPGFFQGMLYVDRHPRDTFIRLPGWSKGVVFINGQNLGRHWSIGPQKTLYLPGPWLKSGNNQIIVFEEQKADEKLVFVENPDHGKTIDVYKYPFCVLL
ncbi:beta-galactosidase-1-like protein 2 isoform X2 [Salvelinus sp. IW2-2015]|uniref:beta-galactosidase-1-like protein 2 isoform X2 n=1 Tax=Salvelinus sp. IW2-2015 TaxID=2691554 RepID=UPI000CDF70E2|nr:beta-galactosidase-1-like protein 2 isoform X2 [Salvelinus alpinus]